MSHYKPLPIIWETIGQKILHHLGYGPCPILNYNFTDGYAINICKAADAQSDIGWDNTLQGLLILLGGCIQASYHLERYSNAYPLKRFTSTAFQVRLTRTMWHIFFGIWRQQNAILHNRNVGTKVQNMDQCLRRIYS